MKKLELAGVRLVKQAIAERRKQLAEAIERDFCDARIVEEADELHVTGRHLLTRWLMNAELRSLSLRR